MKFENRRMKIIIFAYDNAGVLAARRVPVKLLVTSKRVIIIVCSQCKFYDLHSEKKAHGIP